jgi:tripeptidyl-peptidase-1
MPFVSKRGFGMLGHKGGRPPKRRPHNYHIPADLQHRDVTITPACIKALYGVPNGTLANPSNAMGIFEGDYYSQEDLNNFFANFTLYIPQGTHPKPAFIDGAEAPVAVTNAGGESDVDLSLHIPFCGLKAQFCSKQTTSTMPLELYGQSARSTLSWMLLME